MSRRGILNEAIVPRRRSSNRCGGVVVAEHDRRAVHADLADDAGGGRLSVRADDRTDAPFSPIPSEPAGSAVLQSNGVEVTLPDASVSP
ncbi:hypothetical protein GCM10009836_36480 [Pseudonocardia ailaonensis]|uniref:Uncharacterized protein n=1 Tax=Pseudonocardia ailaonensis TaxID=367279 RepID=A0ABN2N9C9_9PSEU